MSPPFQTQLTAHLTSRLFSQTLFHNVLCNSLNRLTWQSDYCYQNKGNCDSNQSKLISFVERMSKNNTENNGDSTKFMKLSRSIEHAENKIIAQSELSENEIGPGVFKWTIPLKEAASLLRNFLP